MTIYCNMINFRYNLSHDDFVSEVIKCNGNDNELCRFIVQKVDRVDDINGVFALFFKGSSSFIV